MPTGGGSANEPQVGQQGGTGSYTGSEGGGYNFDGTWTFCSGFAARDVSTPGPETDRPGGRAWDDAPPDGTPGTDPVLGEGTWRGGFFIDSNGEAWDAVHYSQDEIPGYVSSESLVRPDGRGGIWSYCNFGALDLPFGAGDRPTSQRPRASGPSADIDWAWVFQQSGPRVLHAEPPDPSGPPGGIQIAAGVDLKRLTVGDLTLSGLDTGAIGRLIPFLGLRGDAATAALAQYVGTFGPLAVSNSEAAVLEQAMATKTLAGLQTRYLRDAGRVFGVLSSDVQTAIADLAYQYGSDIPGYSPILWGQLRAGQWALVAAELLRFQGPWAARRRAEGVLVLRALETGPLAQRIARIWQRAADNYQLWLQPPARRGGLHGPVCLPSAILPSYLPAGYTETAPGVGEFLL